MFKNFLIMLFLFISIIISFNSASYALNNQNEAVRIESHVNSPNIISKTWMKLVMQQQILTMKISRILYQIKNDNSHKLLLSGIFIAFLYGIIHAVGPGHSKTLVASYFLSNKSNFIKPIIMAIQIALIHSLSAVILVLITDVSLRSILLNADNKIKIISLISYALIFCVGVYLIVAKIRGQKDEGLLFCKNSTILACSAGLIPCTGALIVMLYAMANQIIMVGIVLVLSMSAGMAFTIGLVGIFSNIANKTLILCTDTISKKPRFLSSFIEYAGFTIITVLGLIMFLTIFSN